nr:hypothetical protein [Tanacetum cinerariifolium]
MFESKTVSAKEHEKRHRSRRSCSPRPSPSVFSRIRHERSRSLRRRSKEGGVFKRLGNRGKSMSARSDSYNQHSHSRYTEALSDSEDSGGNAREKKYIKDPIELHNIKQRDRESTEDFVRRGDVATSNHDGKKMFPP